MFSRIGACICFEGLTKEQKQAIVTNWYSIVLGQLQKDEQNVIKDAPILEWFKENADRYDNIRILKTKLENAIFQKLTEEFIIK